MEFKETKFPGAGNAQTTFTYQKNILKMKDCGLISLAQNVSLVNSKIKNIQMELKKADYMNVGNI